MNLNTLETELRTLLADLQLRTTLERADRIGQLLAEARPSLSHGRWATWLKKLKLNRKTASDYILAHRGLAVEGVRPVGQVGLRAFLEAMREGKRVEVDAARAKVREAAAAATGKLPDTIQIHHADCREFCWPKPIDIVTADPIWGDLQAVEWLADFASGHLRDGGLLFAQTSTHALPEVTAILRAKLHYQWTLAMVFHHVNRSGAGGMFRSTWKPVVVFSKGPARLRAPVSDTYTVHRGDRRYHRFQQPIEPWRYWLGRLAAPDALVAEPFVGSGTIPLVCRDLGLRFVGTEADEGAYKVARGRLTNAAE